MKTFLLFLCSIACAYPQSVLICGTVKGCVFANLDSNTLTYDAVNNRLKSTTNPAAVLSKLTVDVFPVDCATGAGCPGGTAQTVFKTTKPVAGAVLLVFRAISQSPGPANDYTAATGADGTVSVTFNSPADTGNVVLFYVSQ